VALQNQEAIMPKTKSNPTTTPNKPAEAAQPSGPKGKLGILVDLLSQPTGATIGAMQTATGWQAHSIRGAIAGSIKKKLGHAVTSEKVEGERRYRIAEASEA
jgi:hypothetical protein